jgi:hypothetical protein
VQLPLQQKVSSALLCCLLPFPALLLLVVQKQQRLGLAQHQSPQIRLHHHLQHQQLRLQDHVVWGCLQELLLALLLLMLLVLLHSLPQVLMPVQLLKFVMFLRLIELLQSRQTRHHSCLQAGQQQQMSRSKQPQDHSRRLDTTVAIVSSPFIGL